MAKVRAILVIELGKTFASKEEIRSSFDEAREPDVELVELVDVEA